MNEKEQSINISFTKRDEVFKKFCLELENINVKHSELGIRLDEGSWGEYLVIRHTNIEEKINNTKVSGKVLKLIKKYDRLLNITCDNCGKKIEFDSNSRNDLCNSCYFLLKIRSNYEDINGQGFSCFDNFGSSNFYRRKIFWNEIESVNFLSENHIQYRYSNLNSNLVSEFPSKILLKLKKTEYNHVISGSGEKSISEFNELDLNCQNENFYTLLKNIPDQLLNSEDKHIKDIFINHLKDCGICGYKGIFENNKHCIVCDYAFHDIELSDRLKKRYSSVEEVNKEIQLNYFVGLKNKCRYPRLENEFNKSENYKKLVTEKEVEEHFKKNR
jgi:hypothetical protein